MTVQPLLSDGRNTLIFWGEEFSVHTGKDGRYSAGVYFPPSLQGLKEAINTFEKMSLLCEHGKTVCAICRGGVTHDE